MKTQLSTVFFLLICVILSSMFSGCLMRADLIIVDGLERTYYIHVPKGIDGDESVPLVLVFHGGGGNARNIQETTSFNQKADEEGFLVVYPQGSGRVQDYLLTWNAGFCCGYAHENSIDDVTFIKELVTHLKAHYTINDSRIFATGISNGGMMTYRLGAELSDIFAAIAPVAASIGGQPSENESLWRIPEPIQSVSVIVFHGTNDTRIPYDGGRPTANDTKGAFSYMSVNQSIAFWVDGNHCNNNPSSNISISGHIICDTYADGDNDTDVVLYTIINGGHAWPGGKQARSNADIPTDEISATDLIWSFFEDHPKV